MRLVLTTVSDQGEAPILFMAPDSALDEQALRYPQFLPDGQTLMFVSWNQDRPVDLVVNKGEYRQVIMHTNPDEFLGSPVFDQSGHILYTRGNGNERNIWAISFDENRLNVTGRPFIVAHEATRPSVSYDGTLVYRSTGVFRFGSPQGLFSSETLRATRLTASYNVNTDGQQFVMVQNLNEDKAMTLTVVQNWYTEFTKTE